MRMHFVLAIAVTVLSLNIAANDVQKYDSKSLTIAGEAYQIEVAKSYEQRLQGLMFRDDLPTKQGMVFLFPETGNHKIWMKNTNIPLTVIWIDGAETVISVKKLAPCRADPCPIYTASAESNFVLELPLSFNGLKKGDTVPGILNLSQ